ncbi:reverse transcriptase domain-containing protein, partial [Tanacetum coccineum]
RSPELGPPAILATIDETPYTITEESIRSQLQLADDGGIDDLPIVEIYSGMDNLGYVTEGKLTFFKNKFSPQWRFLVHTILHCLSTKSGSWDQFGSSIAVALICLSDGRRFNWSSYIFKGMVNNIGNAKKFLLYPRFLQTILGIETSITRQYHVFKLSSKLFANMKLNFVGPSMPLLVAMLSQAQDGEGAGADVQAQDGETVPETRHESDHSQANLSTPPRQQATPSIAPVFEHGQRTDSNIPSSSRVHETEDDFLGGSFHASPLSFYSGAKESQSIGGQTQDQEKEGGVSSVSPGSITIPTSSSIPTTEPIPARSGATPATPSSPVRDARKGKGVAVEEPTPTQDKTFKQLEEERLGWEAAQRLQAQELADLEKQRAESLMKDANLARQMSQDFEMTEDQRKRQQEVLASAANYSDAAWDIILARLQANPDLSSTIFGVDFTDDDFAAKMVALVNSRRKELAEQRAQERRDRPMTPAQLRQYMRTYLQEEFDKIQRAVAFTRGLKRDGSPMTRASSKKLKTGDVEVDVEAPSHGVPQEVEVEAPSQDVSREKVDAPSHSQNIPEAQVEVPSQEATVEDVEVPSNIASKAQQTASSLKKVGTKKKLLGRKGVHTSQSTIPIEEGDPDAEHKLCIKYASDEDSASDCDTPVHLYAVVDWELLPTGLGSINAIYRLDNSRKYFTSLREILHLVTRADLMTIYGRVMTFYQDKKAEGVGLVLWGDLKILMDSPEVNDGSDFWKNQHTWSIQNWKLYSFSGVHVLETVSGLVIHMFVDKKYPLTINLIERMLDHQLEICHGTVGNELTTAVQLIAFLKKQISDSKRPKVHEWVINSPCYHNKELASPEQTATAEVIPKSVAGSRFPASSTLLPFDVQSLKGVCMKKYQYVQKFHVFKSRLKQIGCCFRTGRVVVSTGMYVVPAGKVIIIISLGRLSLVPTGDEGPSIPTNPSPKKVVERETEETTDKEQTNFQGSTAQIPPPVIPISIPEPDVPTTLPKTTPIPESDIPKSLPKPNIPYPSRRDDQKSRDKASNQMEKIFQIFQDLRFDISFADALLLMPRFAPTIKSLLMNKEKLLELAKIPLNENCSAMLLKKLPEKLGDPGKFLIPCNFPGIDVCHALADLGASINLMPLSIWKKLSLPELTPTRMTLELADRSITYPKGLAEDVFVKVGKFHFPTDFVVVDFEADPRVPLILGRSFLRTGRALIDVYGEEITLRVDNEAVTFNLDQTTRYSSTNDKSVNRIDIIDAVYEEYAPEFLGFPNSSGGNPTPTSEPFTSEFILEEIEAYLKDDSISPEIDHADFNPEEDICLIEKFLNNDPFQLPSMDLKQSEVIEEKSSIKEPPELELKDLPSHLEYAFLEENDKLLVIIAKGLKNDEKDALLKVLKSQKGAIGWRVCIDYKLLVIIANEENKLISTRLVTGWRVCIDYRKLNDETRKDHFPLPFMDQMIERLAGNEFYCFLDGFSGYFQIPIDHQDQEKNTFTCPYGTFAYRRMPFGLCNAPVLIRASPI